MQGTVTSSLICPNFLQHKLQQLLLQNRIEFGHMVAAVRCNKFGVILRVAVAGLELNKSLSLGVLNYHRITASHMTRHGQDYRFCHCLFPILSDTSLVIEYLSDL
jgi:hypothetical protein